MKVDLWKKIVRRVIFLPRADVVTRDGFVGTMFSRIIRTHALHRHGLHQIHCVAIVTQQTGQCHLADLGQLL